MKKFLFSLIAVFLLSVSVAFARQAPNAPPVPVVPDLTNPAWQLVNTQQGQDIAEGIRLFSSRYDNNSENKKAYLVVADSHNLKEDLIMLFGDKNSQRPWVALKADDGKWYVARALGVDISVEPFKDSNGQNAGVKITLETSEGLKEKKLRIRE